MARLNPLWVDDGLPMTQEALQVMCLARSSSRMTRESHITYNKTCHRCPSGVCYGYGCPIWLRLVVFIGWSVLSFVATVPGWKRLTRSKKPGGPELATRASTVPRVYYQRPCSKRYRKHGCERLVFPNFDSLFWVSTVFHFEVLWVFAFLVCL